MGNDVGKSLRKWIKVFFRGNTLQWKNKKARESSPAE
jgi:hypothetical protein